MYGVIRNTVSSRQNHELLKTSYHDFKGKSTLQVLRDQSRGGVRPELRPVTRGEGVKKRPKCGLVVYGRLLKKYMYYIICIPFGQINKEVIVTINFIK